MRELLFSITAKDCMWQYFRASGNGGQKRNKTSNAVRCTHEPSGAIGEATESRNQRTNREKAFERMAKSEKMQKWIKLQVARITGEEARMMDEVKKQMQPNNLLVEVKKDGRWIPENEQVELS